MNNQQRWPASRKFEVVMQVMAGKVTLDDIRRDHAISTEEFQSWREAIAQGNFSKLRATKVRSSV